MIGLTLTDDVFSSVQTSSVRAKAGFQHYHMALSGQSTCSTENACFISKNDY